MGPSEEYVQRRDARQSRVAHYEKVHIGLGNVRLLLAIVGVILAWAAFRAHSLSAWWLAFPVVAFAGIASCHSRVLRSRELAERAAAFYETGLARVEDRWAGSGETGDRSKTRRRRLRTSIVPATNGRAVVGASISTTKVCWFGWMPTR